MAASVRPGWSRRLRALHDSRVEKQLDGLVLSNPLSLTYLTGFTGSSGYLVCGADHDCLVTDGRYEAFVRDSMKAGTIAEMELTCVELRYDDTLAEVLKRLGLGKVGFEASHLTVGLLEGWQQLAAGVTWVSTRDLVERLRLIKDEDELGVLRCAARMLSGVAANLRDLVRPGLTEKTLARRIDDAMEQAGFSRPAFPTIVASGPNSAYPHARPGDRALQRGDLVVLDFGGVLDGYCVDLTRMAAIGPIRTEAMSLVTAVSEAHTAAVKAVRAGVTGAAVDAAARQVLESRGLGGAFLHSTGHGLGLEVHEAPKLARTATTPADTLAAGMVCTIEPGAYVEGLGGVRLEDDVLVTPSGCEVLTDAPRGLLVV